jgi:predicted nucleotide-binding protein (sugar kinase/HSP70/actin superfamily)
MGDYSVAFTYLLEELGNDVVPPDRPSKTTLSRGTRYAPEFFCLPFKITLGTYMEQLDRGAEVIVASGGVGPCRAGHYTQVQNDILRRLGYEFEMIVLEPVGLAPLHFLRCVRRLNRARLSLRKLVRVIKAGLRKVRILDEFETARMRLRPREVRRGSADTAYDEAVALLKTARSPEAIEKARKQGLEILRDVPIDPERPVLRVGIVGEIYILLEPASNLEIERMLGGMGVEVERSIFLSGWTDENAMGGVKPTHAKDAAAPYLGEMIGGHGQDSVGHAVLYAERGFDGVIQLAPFTCVPEIVACGVLPAVSHDLGIPILSFFLDEQTGEAGVRTRVEAFVDMLWQRRQLRGSERQLRRQGRSQPGWAGHGAQPAST